MVVRFNFNDRENIEYTSTSGAIDGAITLFQNEGNQLFSHLTGVYSDDPKINRFAAELLNRIWGGFYTEAELAVVKRRSGRFKASSTNSKTYEDLHDWGQGGAEIL